MADLIPQPAQGALDSMGGSARTLLAQPAVKKMLPAFAGLAGLGVLGLTWAVLSPAPQRALYTQLEDGERASVVAALDQGGIPYEIDNGTGALTVGEDDIYKARMLVASQGALATPESGTDLIANLPMGASRTLEGDRLRAAQERELMLTILEIDGVESARVHIAKAEPSVFVRDEVAPSASIMVRLARGRQLTDGQVSAIANLVAGSVPGLALDAIRIVDQHGKLLTQARDPRSAGLDMQNQLEAELTAKVDQLLSPIYGPGAYSAQVNVELDMSEVTSARESYDKDGAVRRESVQQSQNSAGAGARAGGVPGVLANTPPDPATARAGAPRSTPADAAAAPGGSGESSSTRTFELGREVSVSNIAPGAITHVSAAVALDQSAVSKASAADIQRVEKLVTAAIGARADRGDQVTVIMRPFQKIEPEALPFYETGWFGMALRSGLSVLGVLLVLLLAVRPMLKILRNRGSAAATSEEAAALTHQGATISGGTLLPYDRAALDSQIELAQRIVREQPDNAVLALRKLLAQPAPTNEVA